MENQENLDRQTTINEISDQETSQDNASMLVDCANWEAYNNRTVLDEKVNSGLYIETVYNVVKNEKTPRAKNFRQAWFPKFADKYFDNVCQYSVYTKALSPQIAFLSNMGKMPSEQTITAEYLIFFNGKLKGIAWISNTTTVKQYATLEAKIYIKLNKEATGQETIDKIANYVGQMAWKNEFNFYLTEKDSDNLSFIPEAKNEIKEKWEIGFSTEAPRTLF